MAAAIRNGHKLLIYRRKEGREDSLNRCRLRLECAITYAQISDTCRLHLPTAIGPRRILCNAASSLLHCGKTP